MAQFSSFMSSDDSGYVVIRESVFIYFIINTTKPMWLESFTTTNIVFLIEFIRNIDIIYFKWLVSFQKTNCEVLKNIKYDLFCFITIIIKRKQCCINVHNIYVYAINIYYIVLRLNKLFEPATYNFGLISILFIQNVIFLLFTFQYNSIDTSLLSNYVMHPFWNWCVQVILIQFFKLILLNV